MSRPIRVALAGYGYWGPNVLRNLLRSPQGRVVACCDPDPSRQAALRQVLGARARIYGALEPMIEREGPDAVFIATPVDTHFQLASLALAAGCHVHVEKPLTASSREAAALIRQARQAGRLLMVGHTFEFSPAVERVRSLVESGETGQLQFIDSVRVNLGLHRSDVSVLWDLAVHDVSIVLAWAQEEPYLVGAQAASFVRPDISDIALLTLRFASGLLAHVQVSWLAPVKVRRTTLVGHRRMVVYDDIEPVEKVKVYDRGADLLNDPEAYRKSRVAYRTGDIWVPALDQEEPLFRQCEHFLACIREGRSPRTDGASGLRVVRVLEAAERSLLQGGRGVTLAEARPRLRAAR